MLWLSSKQNPKMPSLLHHPSRSPGELHHVMLPLAARTSFRKAGLMATKDMVHGNAAIPKCQAFSLSSGEKKAKSGCRSFIPRGLVVVSTEININQLQEMTSLPRTTTIWLVSLMVSMAYHNLKEYDELKPTPEFSPLVNGASCRRPPFLVTYRGIHRCWFSTST